MDDPTQVTLELFLWRQLVVRSIDRKASTFDQLKGSGFLGADL
jgi:hypothetical protein